MGDAGTIVVVEDEPAIADLLALYLGREGYRVLLAETAERAIELWQQEAPRVVILDLGLPGALDGLDVCRLIRASATSTPVLILTARDAEIDRVLGLELGADDYVTKPFSPREVVARVKAILRRSEGPRDNASSMKVAAGAVTVDPARREARVDDVVVPLTTREFDLLLYFAHNVGLALTRQQLLDGVWGPGWYGDERTVDVHVAQLRKKLGDAFPLSTLWGVGYRLG